MNALKDFKWVTRIRHVRQSTSASLITTLVTPMPLAISWDPVVSSANATMALPETELTVIVSLVQYFRNLPQFDFHFDIPAVCEAGCENGGICDGPNHCSCPSGFEGSKCQDDVDECALGPSVHQCSEDSICVNKPGWHYCQCRPGFRAYQDPVVDGALICIDENECDLGTHTCHPTAQCWNTGGSYTCYCGANNGAHCSTSKKLKSGNT